MGKGEEFVTKAIADDKVVVFSKTYCPFCTRTKKTLKDLGADYKVYELDVDPNGSAIQAAVNAKFGHRTVPAVFIDGKLVGGDSDVQSLNSSGKLKDMV